MSHLRTLAAEPRPGEIPGSLSHLNLVLQGCNVILNMRSSSSGGNFLKIKLWPRYIAHPEFLSSNTRFYYTLEKEIDYIVLEIFQNCIQRLKQSISVVCCCFSEPSTTTQWIKNPFTGISQLKDNSSFQLLSKTHTSKALGERPLSSVRMLFVISGPHWDRRWIIPTIRVCNQDSLTYSKRR